jgi:hypothetical protein
MQYFYVLLICLVASVSIFFHQGSQTSVGQIQGEGNPTLPLEPEVNCSRLEILDSSYTQPGITSVAGVGKVLNNSTSNVNFFTLIAEYYAGDRLFSFEQIRPSIDHLGPGEFALFRFGTFEVPENQTEVEVSITCKGSSEFFG